MPGPRSGFFALRKLRFGGLLPLLILLAALLPAVRPASAQEEFGKNKVQYGDKTWYVVSTRHFDIHFAQNGGVIAEFAALHLEAMYDTVSRVVGFPLKGKVPIILYGTPAEFQQTNIIPYLLPEGVGGFTEIFKNRVVLPFEGSYVDFHHVLQHELAHAFMFDRQNSLGNKFSSGQQAIPLWFGEGLAEYASLGWDLGSEFFMMDAVLFGYVGNPAQDGLPGFLAYKGGQLFYYYLAQTFGPAVIRDWVGDVAKGKEMQRAFKDLTKVSLHEVGEIWLREIRAIYWPELRERRYGKTMARQLTDHTQDLSGINMQPALSPDGKKIAFFSDRKPQVGVYILDVEKEKVVQTLVYAGAERGHLSFYPFQSRISWSPDGKKLAFVSKTGDRDVISLARVDGKGRAEEIRLPGVQGVLSPSFSPDGKILVFSGMKDGFSDIFLWHMERKVLRRLTYDIAADHNPVFAPSGKWIAFESDRPQAKLPQNPKDPFAEPVHLSRYRDIYSIDTAGGLPSLILGGPFDEKTPTFGPSDSELVIVSNRSGINNMYLAKAPGAGDAPDSLPPSAGTWRAMPISNLTSTCFTPSWSKSGDRLAFTLFEDRGWDVFVMRNPRDKIIKTPLPKTRFIRKTEDTTMPFFSPIALENLSSFVRERAIEVATRDSLKAKDSADARKIAQAKEAAKAKDTAKAPDGAQVLAAAKQADSAKAAGGKSAADGKSRDTVKSGEAEKTAKKAEVPDLEGTLLVGKRGAGGGTGPEADSAGIITDTVELIQTVLTPPKKPDPVPVDPDQVAGADVTKETDYLTRMGAYKLRPYKPKWGLELAAADLGYNTFSQGVTGQTYLTISDLLGNHKISFALSSGGEGLRTINGLVMYDLLPYRMDLSFMAFNFTNYLATAPGLYFFDREFGGGVTARYPLSIFTRFEFSLSGFSVTRDLYDAMFGVTVPDSIYPREQLHILRPGVSWVNDNAEYGITGPVLGRRLRLSTNFVPPLLDDSVAFWQIDGDFRRYWMFWKKYAVAWRVTAGFSQPIAGYGNPQVYLGGGDDLIPFVAHTKVENGPENLSEVAFSQLAVPLRGFRYYEFRGDRKFISNLEFRYPFIETLRIAWPLPINLHYLMGVLFVDYGGAWSKRPREYEWETAMETLGMGYGYGFRLNLGIFVLRYTRAHTVDGVGIGQDVFRDYWSIGADF